MKKLLVLGGNSIECDLVKRAQQLGYYVIVTDNHSDIRLSPAKQIADEGWNISWSDVDILEKTCYENHIDGVVAGFSEFRVENMIKLCERLGLPCGLTMDQLEVTRDKVKFKNLCQQYQLPVIREFSYDSEKEYPVIIKPVDRAGSIGINVANNDDEFEEYYSIALSLSPTKSVIIEDFIQDGIKFDVYYYVQGGKVIFLGSSDTIMCKGSKGAKILQKAWTFPSVYEELFKSEYNALVEKMLLGIGIHDCYITMSAFYRNGKIYFFEAGFRLSGDLSYNYYKFVSGSNYLDSFIAYAIGEHSLTLPISSHHSCYSVILNMFCLSGKVGQIHKDIIHNCKEVFAYNEYVKVGEFVNNKTTVFVKGAMITLCSHNIVSLMNAVNMINQDYDILDVEGNSLIYEKTNNLEFIKYEDYV